MGSVLSSEWGRTSRFLYISLRYCITININFVMFLLLLYYDKFNIPLGNIKDMSSGFEILAGIGPLQIWE